MNYKNTLDCINEFVFIINESGNINYANQAALNATGITRKDINHYRIQQLLSDPQSGEAIEILSPEKIHDYPLEFHGQNDAHIPVSITIKHLSYKDESRYVVCLEDQARMVKTTASHGDPLHPEDPLTYLPTMAVLYDRIELAIHNARRHKSTFCLLAITLYDYERIQNSLGGDYANDLAKQAAERLHNSIRSTDAIAYASNERAYYVLLTDLKSRFEAKHAVEKLLHCFWGKFHLKERSETIKATTGVAIYPSNGDTPQLLIKSAHLANSIAAKDDNHGYHIYGGK